MSLSFATNIRWETEPKLSSQQNIRSKQIFMALIPLGFSTKKL